MSELVDLKKLPAPKVVQELSYETLLAQRKDKFCHYKKLMNCGNIGKLAYS